MAKSTTKCYGNNILFMGMDVHILCRTVSMMFVDMCLHGVCIECLHVVIHACMRNYLCMHICRHVLAYIHIIFVCEIVYCRCVRYM